MQRLNLIYLVGTLFFGAMAFGKDVSCTKDQLIQKNCLLRAGKAQYQFLRENLSIDDGVWKGVVKVPLEVSDADWDSLRLIDRGGRRFYELKIWTPPQEGVELQSLHWLIVELKGTEVLTQINQIIQKRRSIPADGEKKYLKDKMERHQLKVNGKKIHWTVGHLKGEF